MSSTPPLPDPFGLLTPTPASLRHAFSGKWATFPDDVLALWVADMDFPIAPSIRAALRQRLEGTVGYPIYPAHPDFISLLLAKLSLPTFTQRNIKFFTGVVPSLYAAVHAFTAPGDDVLTFTPIYPPFLAAIADQGRNPIKVPLALTHDGYRLDLNAAERALTPKTTLLLFCNPHNPTGRVWTNVELQQLSAFAQSHNLLLVSDELHAGLTLDPSATPFISLHTVATEAARNNLLFLTGPCKTYNTAGLGIGAALSHNPDLIARLGNAVTALNGHPSTMSYTMWQAALKDDGQWLGAVLSLLRKNRSTLNTWWNATYPNTPFHPPEATYLAWLDFRRHPHAATIHKHFLTQAKVALVDAPSFGNNDLQGFLRLNFATTPAILEEALDRLGKA
jgi:cystathionine beta-lyase